MAQHFTHLHLHTDFSLLDGAITLEKLVQFGKTQQAQALAITDHGNVFGAVKFFQLCKKAGIKPILGMEAYFTEDIAIKSTERKYYHLIILVQNEIGYKNLCKLISFAYQKGFYFKPRIDYSILAEYSEGLIVTSACLGGHIPTLLMEDQEAAAQERMDWFLKTFGPERFFLEIQPPDQTEQAILNEKLFYWAQKKGIGLVATGDCHYATVEDRHAHEVMLCIQTQHKITDPDRFTFGDCRVHMRTAQEMLEIFPSHTEAIWNTGLIADRCNFAFPTGKLYFPNFEIPTGHTPETLFTHLCEQGLQELFDKELISQEHAEQYKARLQLEIDLIIKMGFVGYFLIVSDFIRWAKKQGIPVGPGRGSAAGSLVAWALQITNIDPLKYNLLFERFLNPERISMPDIDIDFCIEGREAVIDYIRNKYGHDKVGQIITFGTMMAKGVLKDVARVLGVPFEDSNAITALIPEQLKITLKEALEQEPKLPAMIANNPTVAKVFDLAFRLEGLTRHASKHAAGIVITPEPIDTILPVYVPPKSTELVTQYAMTELEALGFLKIDLLGLKNLTLIERTLKLIARNHGITLDMDKVPLDDPKAFALICQGKTSGVFQLESSGLKDVLCKLQPTKFEDIIAVNALYRPGPLGSGMVDDYIERRHGRQKIVYLFPELKEVLEETYGVIVYQEQVMKIASLIGGYSLGEADILRRAMGKKKAEVMAEQRAIFLERSIARNYDATKAGELFDLMAYFAGYGFNKSHSAAYALIAYHTAFLKANYPAEFMACLISLEAHDTEKMAFYLQEAKDMGLHILPPNINTSGVDFSVINGDILFGLRGIKNVGLAALENMLHERNAQGPFTDLLNLCQRIDLRTANKRVLENLICAGALDCLPGNRAQKFIELPPILEQAVAYKKSKETGQLDLFMMGGTEQHANEQTAYAFAPLPEWSAKEKLEREVEVTGFFLSAHPLDAYQKKLRRLKTIAVADIPRNGTHQTLWYP
jgi:DNA polymerase-3 subunit alpha